MMKMKKTVKIDGKMNKENSTHHRFEVALKDQIGKTFSRPELIRILQKDFRSLPEGSVVPTDHAEPSSNHVNQCTKCANPDYQILDTVTEGQRKHGKALYRVRNFKRLPD